MKQSLPLRAHGRRQQERPARQGSRPSSADSKGWPRSLGGVEEGKQSGDARDADEHMETVIKQIGSSDTLDFDDIATAAFAAGVRWARGIDDDPSDKT